MTSTESHRFAIFSATLTNESWGKCSHNFEKFYKQFPDGFVWIADGIWIVDRQKAELALAELTEQLKRHRVPYIVAPLSSPPTVHVSESALQKLDDIGCDVYPIPCHDPYG